MIEEARKQVCKSLDKYAVALIALLHNVDDYKLFGMESELSGIEILHHSPHRFIIGIFPKESITLFS